MDAKRGWGEGCDDLKLENSTFLPLRLCSLAKQKMRYCSFKCSSAHCLNAERFTSGKFLFVYTLYAALRHVRAGEIDCFPV